jgi:PAS domain S-box-containing protein
VVKSEGILRLLIIDDSLTEAEQIINIFRNAGHAVRAHRETALEALEKQLQAHKWDLLLCSDSLLQAAPHQVTALVQRLGQDLPCIILVSDAADIPQYYDIAAQDIIAIDDQQRIQFAAARELENLQLRRQYRCAERALRESEKRARSLLESYRDAVAYTHQGMHIYVNAAYLQLFGYDSLEEIDGLPLLDLINADNHDSIKQSFRQFEQTTKPDSQRQTVQCRKADGTSFSAEIELSHARLDGEDCTQVVIHDTSSPDKEEDDLSDTTEQLTLEKSDDSEDWQTILPTALQQQRFVLFYQPIVSLHGDHQELYEVIIKLEHQGELIDAEQFMPSAEALGITALIDKWLIELAMAILKQHRQAHPHTRFFIKLSVATLQDELLLDVITNALNAQQLPGAALVVEISETAVLNHPERCEQLIDALKHFGCESALAYFGSGLDLARSLTELNVDYLKLNSTLIKKLSQDAENQQAKSSSIELTSLAGKHVVAEQVSDANSLALLWRLGIDYAQGDYLQIASAQLDYNFAEDEAD